MHSQQKFDYTVGHSLWPCIPAEVRYRWSLLHLCDEFPAEVRLRPVNRPCTVTMHSQQKFVIIHGDDAFRAEVRPVMIDSLPWRCIPSEFDTVVQLFTITMHAFPAEGQLTLKLRYYMVAPKLMLVTCLNRAPCVVLRRCCNSLRVIPTWLLS